MPPSYPPFNPIDVVTYRWGRYVPSTIVYGRRQGADLLTVLGGRIASHDFGVYESGQSTMHDAAFPPAPDLYSYVQWETARPVEGIPDLVDPDATTGPDYLFPAYDAGTFQAFLPYRRWSDGAPWPRWDLLMRDTQGASDGNTGWIGGTVALIRQPDTPDPAVPFPSRLWAITGPFIPYGNGHWFTGETVARYPTRQATAYAYLGGEFGDEVADVYVDDSGAGYGTTEPVVTIDGDGTGATAVAELYLGSVSGVTVTAPGSGYTWVSVTIAAPPAAPTFVDTATVTDGSGATVFAVCHGSEPLYSLALGADSFGVTPLAGPLNPDIYLRFSACTWFLPSPTEGIDRALSQAFVWGIPRGASVAAEDCFAVYTSSEVDLVLEFYRVAMVGVDYVTDSWYTFEGTATPDGITDATGPTLAAVELLGTVTVPGDWLAPQTIPLPTITPGTPVVVAAYFRDGGNPDGMLFPVGDPVSDWHPSYSPAPVVRLSFLPSPPPVPVPCQDGVTIVAPSA